MQTVLPVASKTKLLAARARVLNAANRARSIAFDLDALGGYRDEAFSLTCYATDLESIGNRLDLDALDATRAADKSRAAP